MSVQVNHNTLISPTPLASSSSFSPTNSSGGSANTLCAESAPLHFYNSEAEFQHAVPKWKEETREQDLKELDWLFNPQVNSGVTNGEENRTSDALSNGEHVNVGQPVSAQSSEEGKNNSEETAVSKSHPPGELEIAAYKSLPGSDQNKINSEKTTISKSLPQLAGELTTLAYSNGQSIDPFPSETKTWNGIPRLGIDVAWDDENFWELEAEALKAQIAIEENTQWSQSELEGFSIPSANAVDDIKPVAFNQNGFRVNYDTHSNTEGSSYTTELRSNEPSGHGQVDLEGIPMVSEPSSLHTFFGFPQQGLPYNTESVPTIAYDPQIHTPTAFNTVAILPPIQDSNPFKSESHHLPAEIEDFDRTLQPLQESGNGTLTGNNSACAAGEQNAVPDNTQWPYLENDPFSYSGPVPDFTNNTKSDWHFNGNLGWDNPALPEFIEGSSKGGIVSLPNQNTSTTGPSPAANVGLDSARSIPSYVQLHTNFKNTTIPSPAQFFGRTDFSPVPYLTTSGTQRRNKRKNRDDDQIEGQPKAKNFRSALPADVFPRHPAAIPHRSTSVSAPSEFVQGAAAFSDHAPIPAQTPPTGIQSRHPVPYKLENGRFKCTYRGPASKTPHEECGQTSTTRDSRARNRHLATHAAREEVLLERGLITRDQAVALDWATRTTVTCDKPGCGFSVAVWRTDNVRKQHNQECHAEDEPLPHPWARAELTDWEAAQLRSMCQIIHDAADRLGFKRP